MYVVVVDFVVVPERASEFRAQVIDNARISKAVEPGCRQFDVAVDAGDPGRLFLYELYDDRAAFEEHLRSGHFGAFDAAVRPWILDKTVRTFLLVEPTNAAS